MTCVGRRARLLMLALLVSGRGAPVAAQADGAPEAVQPLPTAPRTLSSWHQAFEQLSTAARPYRIATADLEVAHGRARVALADLLPRADAQASFTHELLVTEENFGAGPVTVPAQDVWGAGISASVPLLDVRALHAYGTAKRAVAAAEHDLAAQRRVLADQLADTLLAAWTAERLAELHRVGLSAALERLALTETKRALGRATTLDIDRARQDVETTRNEALQGDDALVRARVDLGLMLGDSTAVAAPAVGDADGLERSIRAWCTPSDDPTHVPEVAAAKLQVELTQRAIDGLDLELLPRLDLQSQLRWDSETVYGPDATVQLGVLLRAPIWDGGARYGRMREAHALRFRAKLRLEQAESDARMHDREAARAIEVATESARIGLAQRELARRIDHGTRLSFERGLGTSLDLIAAAQALRQAELHATLLAAQLVRARVRATLSNAACHF